MQRCIIRTLYEAIETCQKLDQDHVDIKDCDVSHNPGSDEFVVHCPVSDCNVELEIGGDLLTEGGEAKVIAKSISQPMLDVSAFLCRRQFTSSRF